ncbi:hypothetical protein IGJ02_002620 [Enterococcus sp. DIV0724b]|uniref:WxL protein host-binding domain-containing protein n=1 Tax=Enterococcus sp. DIV0724b TaxID=2774694 RepID=UPI003D2FD4DA
MKKIIHSLLLILVCFILPTGIVKAEEAPEGSIPLSVKANIPENQEEGKEGYFSLKVQPGAEQELSISLKNTGEKEIEVALAVNTATTNQTGSIEYGQLYDKKKKDTSLKFPLSELLIPEAKTVKIPAKKEIEATFKLSVPAERFEGMLLGAINVSPVNSEENNKSNGAVVIKNRYAYNIGVKLTEEEDPGEIKNTLDLLGIEASQITGRNTILARIQHANPTIVDEVSYEAKVYKKNSDAILHEKKAENYRIAPNSTYEFPISWENERFQAGDYRLKMVVSSKKTGEKWEFDKEFAITREEANKLNETAIDLTPDYTRWIILGVVAFVVLIVGLIVLVILLRRRKQKRQALERARAKKKRKKKAGVANNRKKTETGKPKKRKDSRE